MHNFSVSYFDLATELCRLNSNVDLLNDFIKSKNSLLTEEEIEIVKRAIRKRFLGHFHKRFKDSSNNREYFFMNKSNEKWFQSTY